MDYNSFDRPADGLKALWVKDDKSEKVTVVLTKEVQGREINFALDFADAAELDAFVSWLNLDRDYFKS